MKKIKMVKKLSVLLLLTSMSSFLLSGCASTKTKCNKEVNLFVYSKPIGAKVCLSNGMSAITPAKFKVSNNCDLTVIIEKPGYKTVTVMVKPCTITSNEAGLTAGCGLLGPLIGAGVDALFGKFECLTPNPVRVNLEPLCCECEVGPSC